MMQILTMLLGELAANCHLLIYEDNSAIAVDIGNSPERLLQVLQSRNLRLKVILLTHGHYDHIGGVETVRQATDADVYIHEKDVCMLDDEKANLSCYLAQTDYQPVKSYQTIKDGDILYEDSYRIQVMHTPGHTAGGVCYLIENCLFTGDTLFKGSIGRTDLGGNQEDMLASLKKIAALEQDYPIYPGHFDNTSLAYEKQHNPHLRNLL